MDGGTCRRHSPVHVRADHEPPGHGLSLQVQGGNRAAADILGSHCRPERGQPGDRSSPRCLASAKNSETNGCWSSSPGLGDCANRAASSCVLAKLHAPLARSGALLTDRRESGFLSREVRQNERQVGSTVLKDRVINYDVSAGFGELFQRGLVDAHGCV